MKVIQFFFFCFKLLYFLPIQGVIIYRYNKHSRKAYMYIVNNRGRLEILLNRFGRGYNVNLANIWGVGIAPLSPSVPYLRL